MWHCRVSAVWLGLCQLSPWLYFVAATILEGGGVGSSFSGKETDGQKSSAPPPPSGVCVCLPQVSPPGTAPRDLCLLAVSCLLCDWFCLQGLLPLVPS